MVYVFRIFAHKLLNGISLVAPMYIKALSLERLPMGMIVHL